MNFGKRKVGKLWDDEFDIGTNRVKLRWACCGSLFQMCYWKEFNFLKMDPFVKLMKPVVQQKSGQWKKLEVQEKNVKVDFEQYFNE
jgi:hypothetical protein